MIKKPSVNLLSWIIRKCRPELAYRINRLQQLANPKKATIKTIRGANKLAKHVEETSERGTTCLKGIVNG